MKIAASLLSIALLCCAASAHAEPDTRLVVRIAPPITRYTTTDHGARNIGLGGVALGVVLPEKLWIEASANGLIGLEGAGYDVNGFIGYALGDDPQPHAWDFSVPVFLGYRHVRRPSSHATDAYEAHESMDAFTLGARTVWTRTFESNALELGLGASLSVPFARSESGGMYYSDGRTHLWVDVGLTLGFSFGL